MGTTIRCRFVALDLAEGWIELRRTAPWKLKHPERKGALTLSMFPVAEGVTMDLPTLQALSRERCRHGDEVGPRARKVRAYLPRSFLLDQASWSEGPVFCVATSRRHEPARKGPPAGAFGPPTTYVRGWTLSDGRHVLEATLYEYDEERFAAGVQDCDAMMRSVRFEGPS